MGSSIAAGKSSEKVLPFLKSSTFLGCLSDEALVALARKGHTRTCARGEVVWWRGAAGDSVMIILAGRLKISNTTPDGREIGFNFLGPGDLAGEIAVLDGLERTANVTVLEPAELFVIYRRDLLPALRACPDAMFEIIQVLCEKLRIATAIIEDSTQEMRGRVARGLIRLAQQHGLTGKGRTRINLKLSQSELGSYFGLSRANVSRELSYLKDAGIIELNGPYIIVLDEEALAKVAEGPPEDHG
jgi:CRP-like cAMP-binding protein